MSGLKKIEKMTITCQELDIQKKMAVVKNVVRTCQQEQQKHTTLQIGEVNVLKRVKNYTGVTMMILDRIQSTEDDSRKSADWLAELKNNYNTPNYFKLRTYLYESYVVHSQIPKIKDMLEFFNCDLPDQRNNLLRYFRKHYILYQILYPLSETESGVIVERPEHVMARHRYLYNKLMFKEDGRIIVYVDEIFMNGPKPDGDEKWQKNTLVIAASPQLGYISSLHRNGGRNKYLIHWLKDSVVQELPPKSVIIFQAVIYDNFPETPNEFASKKAMVHWLEELEIPHDPTVHRAELYQLIQKYAANNKVLSKVEHIIQAYGHTVVLMPNTLDMHYLKPLLKKAKIELGAHLKGIDAVKQKLSNLSLEAPKSYWEELESILVGAEAEVYKKDMLMEEVIDKLMTYIKYNYGVMILPDTPQIEYRTRNDKEYYFM